MYHFWDRETFEYTESAEVKAGRVPANGDNSPLISYNLATQKLVRDVEGKKWIVKSLKEFTEHLINIGLKTKTDSEKINELGEIVAMTREELIESGKITRDEIYQNKLFDISAKAKKKIEGGFESNANSELYIYDSELEDQFNMQTLVMSGVDSAYRCTKKSNGVKDFYLHTNAQLAQIVAEFTQYKISILQKAQEFRVAIAGLNGSEIDNFVVNYDVV